MSLSAAKMSISRPAMLPAWRHGGGGLIYNTAGAISSVINQYVNAYGYVDDSHTSKRWQARNAQKMQSQQRNRVESLGCRLIAY